MTPTQVSEVFSAREVAQAAGVPEEMVLSLADTGAITVVRTRRNRAYLEAEEAVRVGRALAFGIPITVSGSRGRTPTFQAQAPPGRARAPFAVSSAAHVIALALAVAATVGVQGRSRAQVVALSPEPLRLVYLVSPGTGGGGGGGGARKPTPASKAQRQGKRPLSSPVPASPPPPREPPRVTETQAPVEPQIEAPVAAVPADLTNRPGVVEDIPPQAESAGPGAEGNAGSGRGSGAGGGQGRGIGDGEGAGTGGGPYRPGSGIEPPQLLREIKPQYTEAARQRGIQGDVLLEIVVHRNGSVGDVRVLHGLGHGLDQHAIDAVRQWTFSPARRHGVPVDVLVEVAMEFRIR